MAFDIDARKVGKDIFEAIFELPNCTTVFCLEVPKAGVPVRMGQILDGVAGHMSAYPEKRTFLPSDELEASSSDVVAALEQSGAEILVSFLPVGSEKAAHFYAECALEGRVAVVNCIPVFLASNSKFSDRFKKTGIPIIDDDIKTQLDTTITHRILIDLSRKQGVTLDRTYQLNTWGNIDFLNILDRKRLASKKRLKTETIQSVAGNRIDLENIHVGSSDYVAWQNDNKVCFIRMEGKLFGDVPLNLELCLSVEDSSNSAGVAIDAIRCVKLVLDRGIGVRSSRHRPFS